jgi:hypothetical protein
MLFACFSFHMFGDLLHHEITFVLAKFTSMNRLPDPLLPPVTMPSEFQQDSADMTVKGICKRYRSFITRPGLNIKRSTIDCWPLHMTSPINNHAQGFLLLLPIHFKCMHP